MDRSFKLFEGEEGYDPRIDQRKQILIQITYILENTDYQNICYSGYDQFQGDSVSPDLSGSPLDRSFLLFEGEEGFDPRNDICKTIYYPIF